jgi:aminopeptidase YwaD
VVEEIGVNRRTSTRFFGVSGLIATTVLLIACNGGSSPAAPMATPAQTGSNGPPAAATQAPQANAPAAPAAPQSAARNLDADGNRIYEDVKLLSASPRASGTAREKEASEFIAEKLRTAGYDVSFQEFTVETSAREASVATTGANSRKLTTLPLARSGSGKVQSQVVAAGIGRANEFPGSANGAIVLIERGELQFNEKVTNAQNAGAAGVVIYNNEPDVFNGSLGFDARVPVVAISQAEGRALASELSRGARIELDLNVGANGRGISRNVIARPPDRDCETVTGGHYDSVPQAPGASDNATGTATVIEIASIIAARGEMGSNCFILFGSEELGLIGSRFYVDSLDGPARRRIKAMLNFDMVGVGNDGWLFIGDANLQRQAQRVASTLEMTGALGALRGASSDHASFTQSGIPAFMLYRTTDNLLHTPQDVIDRVRPELLEQAARLGVGMLEAIATGG